MRAAGPEGPAGTRRLRVLVAGRHEAARAGLRAALTPHGLDVCARCTDAADVVAWTAVERPDVCVLEVGLQAAA
jgi:DNA-binding NarL/FixJ family response regulator